jgi:DNA-binding CsgD family transcriptional regulator
MTGLDVRALVRAAFAAGSANAANAAAEILEALRPATGHEAGAILAWEPRAREHIVLANSGYDPHTLASLGEPYATSQEHRLECALKRALRIDDIPYDYRASDTFREVLAPAGFNDGMTICMFAARSAYAGMLHVSAASSGTFGEDSRDLLNTLSASIASVCDLRALRWPMPLPEDCRASFVDSLGREWPLASHESASIVHEAQFQDFLEHFFSRKRASAAGLFPLSGGWLEVRVDLVRDPLTANANRHGALVVERPSELPYGLSPREFDILNAAALGHANQRIALERSISLRTVTTHVERILEKVNRSSRAGAAVRALNEGRLRLDLEISESEPPWIASARHGPIR